MSQNHLTIHVWNSSPNLNEGFIITGFCLPHYVSPWKFFKKRGKFKGMNNNLLIFECSTFNVKENFESVIVDFRDINNCIDSVKTAQVFQLIVNLIGK